jgi:hypothetical protein
MAKIELNSKENLLWENEKGEIWLPRRQLMEHGWLK